MNPDDPRHGSYAGWNAHRATNTPMCDACRKAQNDYQNRWRANKTNHQAQLIVNHAGDAARRQLARNHPEEYRQLYSFFKARMSEKKTA